MIKAQQSKLYYIIFHFWTKIAFKRNFHKVEYIGTKSSSIKPIIGLANHISWWDSIWARQLTLEVYNRDFNVMMSYQMLNKNKALQKIGHFSIDYTPKRIIESLQYTLGLTRNPKNLVFMAPQGIIHSSQQNTIQFKHAPQWLLKNADFEFDFLFTAYFVDYFSNKKPTVSIYHEQYTPQKNEDVNKAYQIFYNTSKLKQSQRTS